MGSRDFPQRVYALRNQDATTTYSFGVGTYVGDLRAPWCADEPDEATREIIVQVLEEEDKREEPFGIGMIQWSVDQGHIAEEEGEKRKAEVYEKQKADAARPLEERIADSYALLNTNPCIQLDDGNTIWGAQCWWGPEEKYAAQTEGRAVEIVPVPPENPRWKD